MSIITRITYTADGTSNIYTIPFDYLSRSHIFMKINGVESEFSWLSAYSVQADVIPVSGTSVEIYRNTPYEEQFVSWTDGTVLFSADLNAQALQTLFVLQENEQIKIGALEALAETLILRNQTEQAHDATLQLKNETSDLRDLTENIRAETAYQKTIALAAASSANQSKEDAIEAKDQTLEASFVQPWDEAETYNFPALVARPDGHTYRCIGTNVIGTAPESSIQWVRITTFIDAPWPDGSAFIDGGTF